MACTLLDMSGWRPGDLVTVGRSLGGGLCPLPRNPLYGDYGPGRDRVLSWDCEKKNLLTFLGLFLFFFIFVTINFLEWLVSFFFLADPNY